MIYRSLADLLQAVFACDIPAFDALTTVYYMDVTTRKALMTLCQTQSMPDEDSTVALRLSKELQTPFEVSVFHSNITMETTLQEVIQPLRDYIQSPVLSGLISMLVRNIPYNDHSSVKDTFEKGLGKEISAAMEVHHPTIFNWDSILSHDRQVRRRTNFHSEYGHSAEIRDFIYHSIRGTIPRLTRRPLYPVIGKKTIGTRAFEEVKEMHQGERFREESMNPSIRMVERLYSITGQTSTGVTELRWSWKYGQLKPRIYYARGPTDYHASKYIQPIFNLLIDALPTTHRKERFFARSLDLSDDLDLFIYDYESFTSLFEEVKNFILALARFFKGTRIPIVDTHHGVIEVDVGAIFENYYETCCNYPSFDISGCSWDGTRTETDEIQHTCGMLGVPGNISSCTLAHGIHLIQVLEDLGCKVVGDDAIGATLQGPEEILDKLRNIGRIQEIKMEIWPGETREDDQGLGLHTWHYCKRPILRISNQVIQGYQLAFFPIADFLGMTDDFHTVSPPTSRSERLRRQRNTLLSFLSQIRALPYEPTEIELVILDRYYAYCKNLLWRLYKEDRTDVDLHILPSRIAISFDFDAWFQEFEKTISSVPVEVEELFEIGIGYECKGPMTQALKLAESIGYAECKAERKQVIPSDYRELFQKILLKTDPIAQSYTFTVSTSCPRWLATLIISENDLYFAPNHSKNDCLPDMYDSDSDIES